MIAIQPDIRTFTVLIPRPSAEDQVWIIRCNNEVIGSATVDMSDQHLLRAEIAYHHPIRLDFEEGRVLASFDGMYVDLNVGKDSKPEVLV